MNERLTMRMQVLPSMCDHTSTMGLESTVKLFMDIASVHAEQLGVGMTAMREKKFFWLTARTMVHMARRPRMLEPIEVVTWPMPVKEVRCVRQYEILSGGEPVVTGKTVWAILDLETKKVLPAKGFFPAELAMPEDDVCPQPFARISKDFSDAQTIGTCPVRSTDIDLGGHMNNAAYVRALLGCLPCAEQNAEAFTDLEINYLTSCYEGDTLTFRRRQTDGAQEIGVFTQAGVPAALARLSRRG